MKVNRFFERVHTTDLGGGGDSKTIPDQSPDISELLKKGKIEQYSEVSRRKMIFGKRIKIEDLTAIDHFRNVKNRYDNLMRTKNDFSEAVQSDEDEVKKSVGSKKEKVSIPDVEEK